MRPATERQRRRGREERAHEAGARCGSVRLCRRKSQSPGLCRRGAGHLDPARRRPPFGRALCVGPSDGDAAARAADPASMGLFVDERGLLHGAVFLPSGYFTPGAFDRKGAGAFLEDRWTRLGLPLLFGWIVLAPLPGWAQITFGPARVPRRLLDLFDTGLLRVRTEAGELACRHVVAGEQSRPSLVSRASAHLRHALRRASRGHGLAAENACDGAALAPRDRRLCRRSFGGDVRNPHLYPQDRWIGFLGYIQMEPPTSPNT